MGPPLRHDNTHRGGADILGEKRKTSTQRSPEYAGCEAVPVAVRSRVCQDIGGGVQRVASGIARRLKS